MNVNQSQQTEEVNVKRFAIGLTILAFLMLSVPASAVDLTGKFSVGGFLDYGVGLGESYDDFEEYVVNESQELEVVGTSSQTLGFSVGAYVMYHFAPQMAIMGLFDYQTVKFEFESSVEGVPSADETENWMMFGANFVYFLMPDGETRPYFMAGPAMYMPSVEDADSRFGFNGGIGILHFFQENVAFNGGARFHYISLDTEGCDDCPSSATHLEAFAGVSFFFGGEE
jgi:hypothetical protein